MRFTILFHSKRLNGLFVSLSMQSEYVEAGTWTQWRTLVVVAAVDQLPTRD